MRSRVVVHVFSLAVLPSVVACGPQGEDYSPSLTQIRVGEVEVVEPPPVPDDQYVPGIVVAPEDYDYSEEGQAVPMLLDTTLLEQLADPAPLDEHKDMPYVAAPGSLFDEQAEKGVEYDDVRQGAIGDCYFAAALSAALYTDADQYIRGGLIREVRNSSDQTVKFAVRFYDAWGKPQDVFVDADLVRRNGRPLYARSADSAAGAEEWAVGLIEKGYAQWHGGFEKIGNGGYAGDVLQALTGSNATYRGVERMSPAAIYSAIDSNIQAKKPVVACTHGEDDGVDYTGSGVYANHCYSVLGVKKNGENLFVTLRNPWGMSEPANNGADDGIFDFPMADFMRLYPTLSLGGGTTPDRQAPAAVTNLVLAQTGDGTLAVTWKATGDDGKNGLAADYDVRVSTSMITADNFYQATKVSASDPQNPGAAERLDLTQLTNGTRYYVAIKVMDESGNASPMSNVVSGTPASATGSATASSFDFESGNDGFTATGLWHRTSLEGSSGTHSFWFGDESSLSYATGGRVSGELTSPVLEVPLKEPRLSWKHILDVEAELGFDNTTVEIATAAGGFSNWETIWSRGSLASSFTSVQVALTAYAGQRVQVRFVFDSQDGQNNDGLGWLVDEIRVD